MHRANWDDLRYILAVADAGSVSEAARRLGVNHATVLRRINAFEEVVGAPVFERGAQGYRLRPDRLPVIEAAREAAGALERAGRHLRETLPDGGSVLRLTSVDSLCQTVLAEGFAQIAHRILPHRLVLVSANAHLDLSRMQADVTVRPSDRLDDDMDGELAAELGFAVYARPEAPDQWLGLSGPLASARPGRWMAQNVPQQDIRGGADSFQVLRTLALSGFGQAVLPCVLGDMTAGLQRRETEMPVFTVPLWVACHRDLAGISRIESLRRAVLALLRGRSELLAGVKRPSS